MKLYLCILLITALFYTPAYGSNQRSQDIQDALSRLEEGTHLLEQRNPRSASTLGEASAMLQYVIDEHDVHTANIYHALGNSYMLNGDLGHAILAYRNGEQLNPTNVQIKESLDHARSLVAVRIEPSSFDRAWSVILSWRGYIPRRVLWVSFVCMFTLGWIALSSRVLNVGTRTLSAGGVWLIGISLIPVGLLGAEWFKLSHSVNVVVIGIGTEVLAMSGPDDQVYDPVYVEAIQPGVEAQVLESRDDWHKLELADGTQCWVPQMNVGIVSPSGSSELNPPP